MINNKIKIEGSIKTRLIAYCIYDQNLILTNKIFSKLLLLTFVLISVTMRTKWKIVHNE